MKNAFWGYWLILLGVFIVVIMLLVQNLTSSSTQDYYLIKELTEAAMIDAVDYSYYRNFGEIRINKEKFYESFMRRFSETASLSTTYTVSFYGVYEAPPKASVEIKSKSASFNIVGDSTSFDMVERINAIIEGNPINGSDSSSSGQTQQGGSQSSGDKTLGSRTAAIKGKSEVKVTKLANENPTSIGEAISSDVIYSTSYAEKLGSYTYKLVLLGYDATNTSSMSVIESDYFGDIADYQQYLSERDRKATLYNRDEKYNSKVNSAQLIMDHALSKANFDYQVGKPYLTNDGKYQVDVTVNVKNFYGVSSYHDDDLNSDIYYVPVKLRIECVSGQADTNANSGNSGNSGSSNGNGSTERSGSEKVISVTAKEGDYIQPLEPLQGAVQTQVAGATEYVEDPYAPWALPIGSDEPSDPVNQLYLGPVPAGVSISSPSLAMRKVSGKKAAPHIAIDVKAPHDSNVISASSGVVTYVYKDCEFEAYCDEDSLKNPATYKTCYCGGERGNQVYVLNDNGVLAIYQHLAAGSIKVAVGDRVKRGQLIANVGTTGYCQGTHLHFEVHENPKSPYTRHDPGGTKVNPERYVSVTWLRRE